MIKKIKSCFTRSALSNAISLCIAVAFYLIFSNIGRFKVVLSTVRNVLSPFMYAFALAFLLNRPEKLLEGHLFKDFKPKARKSLAVFSTFIGFFVMLYLLLILMLPQVGQSLSVIAEMAPVFLGRAYNFALKLMTEYNFSEQLTGQLETFWRTYSGQISEFIMQSLSGLFSFSIGIGNSLIKLLMTLVITLYMLMDKDRLKFQLKKAMYAYMQKADADRWVDLGHRCEKIFSDFIVGKIIDSFIIAILTFVGMLFIYPDYAVLIAVIIGITNMIPFFGPFIGAIPSVFILLMAKPVSAVVFTIFILALQQFDGNILGPKILGDSLGLSALWILVAITVGNGLFGFAGMFLGVPTFAVIYNLISEDIFKNLTKKDISVDDENNKLNFE